MSVADKLCNDIVEPVLKQASTRTQGPLTSSKSSKTIHPKDNRTIRSVSIHKKEEITTLGPRDHTGSRVVLNKLKSKETVYKKNFLDTAINTLVTGPLKCDNNCVTNVRTREGNYCCKCGSHRRTLVDKRAKEIQTFKGFLFADKACGHCLISNMPTIDKETMVSNISAHSSHTYPRSPDYKRRILTSPRRWSVSPYRTTGPDF